MVREWPVVVKRAGQGSRENGMAGRDPTHAAPGTGVLNQRDQPPSLATQHRNIGSNYIVYVIESLQ